jgi:hypothetical protein
MGSTASVLSDEITNDAGIDVHDSFEELYSSFDDDHTSPDVTEAAARKIWSAVKCSSQKAAGDISSCMAAAMTDPQKFAKFLRINRAPGMDL